jgi:hypothetical protein
LITPKEGGPLSNDKIINLDFFNKFNEEMEDVTNVEEGNLFLLNEFKEIEELMDDGLEFFVQKERLHQIVNLILKKQADNLMFVEISNYEDFEDLMRCVDYDEDRKNE